MEITEKVRGFLRENFYIEGELKNDSSLLAQGVVDSTGILEVIGFLEEHFGIRVEDAEMVPENLDSVDAITAFVRRKAKTSTSAEAGDAAS